MKILGAIHGVCCAVMAGAAACALGQGPASSLPAAQPTTSAVPTNVPAVAMRPAREVAQRPKVSWAGGMLTIAAENSSLNQILREVARQTGMKVTGGVADERVYGSYGPGRPEAVLAALLTGTGSNLLLKENTAERPMELVLTPRQGGATPPGPATYGGREDEHEDDLPPQRIVPTSRARTERTETPAVPTVPAVGSIPAGDVTFPPAPVAVPAGATATDAQSPNGLKTPQQIYDQLMKLQQQKAATPPQ